MLVNTNNLEIAIISEILSNGKGFDLLESWWIDENSFANDIARSIYKAMKWLHDHNYPIDPVLVIYKLEEYYEESDEFQHIPHELVYEIACEATNNGNIDSYVKLLHDINNDYKNEKPGPIIKRIK